jgi:hypothetical protein
VSRRELIKTFGVLRRPQTDADRNAWVPGFFRTPAPRRDLRLRDLKVDRALIRTVRFASSGFQAEFLPAIWKPSPAAARRLEGLVVTLDAHGVYHDSTGPRPTSAAVVRRQGLALFAYPGNGINDGVLVVPDGVARVALGPFRLIDQTITAAHPHIANATSMVRDNVASFQLAGVTMKSLHLNPAELGPFFYSAVTNPSRHLNSAVYAMPAVAQMTWFDARGQVISRSAIHTYLYVGTQHPVVSTEHLLLCPGSKGPPIW